MEDFVDFRQNQNPEIKFTAVESRNNVDSKKQLFRSKFRRIEFGKDMLAQIIRLVNKIYLL